MTENRRPLASRQTGWAAAITRRLAATSITPNQISAFSIVAACAAGLALASVARLDGAAEVAMLLLGAALVQLRLLCNLFDGMLAVEAGRGGPTGAFWNEVPDRPADIAILVGLGIGAGLPWLGWAAAALAVFVAYLRAFGQSLGQPADYRGPMAKQHRMALVTLAAVAGALLTPWMPPHWPMRVALWLIVAGAAVTAWRRGRTLHEALR